MGNAACAPRDVFLKYNSYMLNFLNEMIKYISGVATKIEPHKHGEPIVIDLMVFRKKFEKLNDQLRDLFLKALKAEYRGSG